MTNNDFCMKTRLCNYFITTNSIALTKAVLESPYRVLPRTLKATTLKRPVHFYWPPHFDNVNQTCFFGNCMLTYKQVKEPHFFGHLVRSKVYLKLLKIYVLWRSFFEKCSKPKTFISKIYRQRLFRSENFDYKRPLFFKLRVIELAILFNWFLNRSPEIKPNENSTKLPTSNTNFGKKVPISESYHHTLTLLKRLKFLWPLAV